MSEQGQLARVGWQHRPIAWLAEQKAPGSLPLSCPEIMDAVDATMEKLRAQCLSRGASGIQGLAK